jgi:hypothetical protein
MFARYARVQRKDRVYEKECAREGVRLVSSFNGDNNELSDAHVQCDQMPGNGSRSGEEGRPVLAASG